MSSSIPRLCTRLTVLRSSGISPTTSPAAQALGPWRGFREAAIAQIRDTVGDRRVICGLSGGVDSSVVAVLLFEAIGAQLTCVFVATGLLRAGEAEEVVRVFRDGHNISLVHRDAGDLFLERLAGIADPEEKRKTIGATFIEVFEAEARAAGGADFLAQGHALSRRNRIGGAGRGSECHNQIPPQRLVACQSACISS